MNSRSWGPGQTPGVGSTPDRGTAGADAPIRTGSALTVIAWASALLTLLCVVLAFVAGVANGLLILATVFAVIFAASRGAFTREFWVGEMPDELDFIESVASDLDALPETPAA